MGPLSPSYFRWMSKPIKRKCFAKGKAFTDYAIRTQVNKYTLKYLRKRNKVANEVWGVDEMDCTLLQRLSDAITLELMNAKKPKTVDEIKVIIRGVLKKEDGAAESAAPEQPFVTAGENTDLPPMVSFEEISTSVAEYAIGLKRVADTNIGLDHGKCREYWLSRGPRQFGTMCVYVIISILMSEYLKEQSFNDRLYSFITWIFAVVIAFFMLYYRLPDSINSSVLRSCHDFYTLDKKKTFGKKEAKAKPKPAEVAAEGDNML